MIIFNDIVFELKNILSEDSNLNYISFVDSYRHQKKPNLFKKTCVTLGIKSIDIKDKSLGNYLGITNNISCYGKNLDISISLKIYPEMNGAGTDLINVFSDICDSIFSSDIKHEIIGIKCLDIKFDNYAESLVLECIIKMNITIS